MALEDVLENLLVDKFNLYALSFVGLMELEDGRTEQAKRHLGLALSTTGSPHANASRLVLPPDQCSVSSIASQTRLTRR